MELYRALPEKMEPNRINDKIGFESFSMSFRLMKRALQPFALRVKIEYYSVFCELRANQKIIRN